MQYTFFDFLQLIGSLGLFLFGMKTMSEGLQKIAGDRLRSILTAMTTNRVTGILTGMSITALIQSSSATTVMVVSFVNAKLLTLTESIGVIMGANIGTTVTAWIISVFGFKVNMGAMALPLLGLAIPLIFSKKSKRKSVGEFIFGFAFLFMGMMNLKLHAPDLNHNPEMLAFVQNYTNMGYGSIFLFLLIGTALTCIVQASAATMAITLIMCANGWISLELGAALVLGENIGTTITANLAALTGNTQARRAALAHLVFNIFGVFWVLILFHPFMHFINWLVDNYFFTSQPEVLISYKLSAFHSIFNICNVLFLIWGVKLIEKTVCYIIKDDKEDDEYRLRYINSGMMSTAELSIVQARKEVQLFSVRTTRMFHMIKELLHTEDDEKFNEIFNRIQKYETISDNMEIEIAHYLTNVLNDRLSAETKHEIQSMMREVSEIESIGDGNYNMARIIKRYRKTKESFTDEQFNNIHHMLKLIANALKHMDTIAGKEMRSLKDLEISRDNEIAINSYRDLMKKRNIIAVNEKQYDYQIGIYFMDIISECEKVGDYVMNVAESKQY